MVFPGPNQDIAGNDCANLASTAGFVLDPSSAADADDSPQMKGYRVQYFGTNLLRRNFLPEQGTNG